MVIKESPRLIGVDIFRGALIWMLLFLHNLSSYRGDLDSLGGNMSNPIVSSIGKFLGLWGSFFFIITGFANTISLYRKYENPEVNSRKIIFKNLIKVLILIGFDRISGILIGRESRGGGIYNFNEGPIYYSIFLGWLKTGMIHTPQLFFILYFQTAVTTLAYVLLILTFTEVILFKKRPKNHRYRNMFILTSISIFIFIISPFVIQLLRPMWVDALINNNIGRILIFGVLVGDTQSLLPYLGFGFVGAVFGLAYEMRIPRKPVVIIGSIFSLTSGLIGIIGYIILGEPPYEFIIQTLPGRAMWLLIAIMVIPILLIYYFEFVPKSPLKLHRLSLNIQRFGKVSLSLYVIEGVVGESLILLISLIFPDWASKMQFLAPFGIILIIIWGYLLRWWERVNYVGSAEWMIQKAIQF